MPDKKPEWSDYSYNNSDIAKRLGVSREEVEDLKAEAAKKSEGKDNPDVKVDVKKTERKARGETALDVKIGTDNVGVDFGVDIDFDDPANSKGEAGIKIPGFGLSVDTQGGGDIDLLGVIRVETIRIKCYYVQRFYFGGQYLYSDIQRIDSEECKPKEPEPEPEPEPDPKLDPPEPLEPWPPEPKGGSNKIVRKLIGVASSYRRTVGGNDGFSENVAIDGKSRFSNINKKDETFTLTVTQTGENSNIKIVNGLFGGNSYEAGNPVAYSSFYEPRFIHATGGFVFTYTLMGLGGIYVTGTEKDVNNYLDTLEREDNVNATISGGTYSYRGIHKQYDPRRIEGGFKTHVSSWDVPSGWPLETSSYLSEITRIKVTQVIDVDNYVEQPILEPSLQPFIKGKEMNEDCCRIMRKLAKYQGLGDSVKPIKVKDNEIKEKGGDDDIFPLEVPERWFNRKAKPTDKTEIKNMRHLLLSIGTMIDRFEELFNPAGKDSAFPLKKPEEGLWKWLPGDGGDYKYPDPNFDPKKSKDDGKIGLTNLKIETYLDLFKYFLESQIRLEMLFPIAQIRDSKISKRLIYPKASGEIQINDLIQFQELLLLYFNKTLGDPSGSVIIKDADPVKEGAQPLTIENFDISEMLRKLIRFSVDINSDVDLANNFGKRTLYQVLSAMQVLVQNYEMTEAIFEDLGIKEQQEYTKVKLYADPYAGGWKAGEGFDPNRVKVENTEANIEANLEAFLQEKEIEVKVSRRAKTETTDIRDLLNQIGRYAAETAAQSKIPNTPEAIQSAIDKARFELQTDSAIRRVDVRQASAAGRVRTKRNNSKKKR